MTPAEYSSFRNTLGRSSGFQSLQYRLLEFKLGNKNREMVAVHKRDAAGAGDAAARARMRRRSTTKCCGCCSRRGYGIPENRI